MTKAPEPGQSEHGTFVKDEGRSLERAALECFSQGPKPHQVPAFIPQRTVGCPPERNEARNHPHAIRQERSSWQSPDHPLAKWRASDEGTTRRGLADTGGTGQLHQPGRVVEEEGSGHIRQPTTPGP